VYTDHNPLQFLECRARHNAKLLRWSLELQQYNLNVQHRSGKENLFPDILSRPSEYGSMAKGRGNVPLRRVWGWGMLEAPCMNV